MLMKDLSIIDFRLRGAETILDGILGGAGIGTSLFSSSMSRSAYESALQANREENQKNRDFNREEAEKQRQWQSDEWTRQQEFTNEYAKPVNQIARLNEAGLNAGAMLNAGNAGLSQAPSLSTPTSPAASITTPNVAEASNTAVGFGSVASGIADLIKSLSSSNVDSAQANEVRSMLFRKLGNIDADTELKKMSAMRNGAVADILNNNKSKISKYLDKTIDEIGARITLANSQSDLVKAQKLVEEAREKLLKHQSDYTEKEFEILSKFSEVCADYLQAKISNMNASTGNLRAGAFKQSEEGRLLKDTHDSNVTTAANEASIKYYEACLKRISYYTENQTYIPEMQARIMEAYEAADRAGLINEELREQIEQLRHQNNWFGPVLILRALGAASGMMIGGAALKGTKGAK